MNSGCACRLTIYSKCFNVMLYIYVAGCETNKIDGFISSMDLTITTTFWADNPNVTFDCRIHKKDFKDCEYYVDW